MTLATLTSPKLTELEQQLATQKAGAKRCKDHLDCSNRLRYPTQWRDVTVVRVTDVDVPTATFLGIKPRPEQHGVLAIGSSEQDDAARKQDILKRTLAGESLADAPSASEQDEAIRRQYIAHEIAIEFLNREIERERGALAAQYAKSYKPIHDKQMTALGAAALDFYAKYADAYDGKRHLIDGNVGLRDGMYHNLPEPFLGTPNNPYSEFASFLTAAKAAGYIKEVPAPLRMKVAK